jgi:hypothetical protein
MNKLSSFLFYTNYRLAPVIIAVGLIDNNITTVIIGVVTLLFTSLQATLKD